MKWPSQNRLLWLALISLLVAMAGSLGLVLSVPATRSTINSTGGLLQPSGIGGAFRLTTHEGKTLTDQDLRGTPHVVFFGFTHCPDVCPTALWNLSELLKALGPDGDKLKVILISVDAERDRPETLATYLQSFDPRIVGLTGSAEEIDQAAKAFKAFIRKVALKDGGFTFDHTATIYLMDRKGRFFSTLDIHEAEDARLAKVRRLIKEG